MYYKQGVRSEDQETEGNCDLYFKKKQMVLSLLLIFLWFTKPIKYIFKIMRDKLNVYGAKN
jgi:hypothetical protein